MTQAERDAKAVELMTAAGYGKDKPLTINYIYNTSEAHKKIATVVSQMWQEKLGVTLNLAGHGIPDPARYPPLQDLRAGS